MAIMFFVITPPDKTCKIQFLCLASNYIKTTYITSLNFAFLETTCVWLLPRQFWPIKYFPYGYNFEYTNNGFRYYHTLLSVITTPLQVYDYGLSFF